MYVRSGVSEDLVQLSDRRVCSCLIYRKGVSPSSVNEILTPKDSRISPKIACMNAQRSEQRFSLCER
ncbi:hypothetical protein [uncultured Helicobacter sp.]|uniref:hypothetical protein n=1 Tax=uncultured Helicobacter sp. TaxID=175537 RepID=UPI00374E70BF